MCVLCHRRFVQSLFHDIVYNIQEFRGIIQRYGNICGHPGEYAKEVRPFQLVFRDSHVPYTHRNNLTNITSEQVALICPPSGPTQCMPLPGISHQRNRYTVVIVGGVRHIIQHNMSPEVGLNRIPPSALLRPPLDSSKILLLEGGLIWALAGKVAK